MANRYWVGGSGSWDASNTANWSASSGGASGASVPVASDDVFIDANSGTGTVTVSQANCRNLDFTGYTGTFAGTGTLNVYGNLTFSAGMTRTYSGTFSLRASLSGKTITMNGQTVGTINFNGSGDWTLQDAFTVGASNTLAVVTGTLNTNNQAVSAGVFSQSGGTVNCGSSVITVQSTGTVFTTNGTFNAGTSEVVIAGTSSVARTITTNGRTLNKLTIAGGTSTGQITITNAGTFNEIASTRTAAYTIQFPASITVTTTNWSVNGSSGNLVSLRSSSAGTQFTLAKAGGGSVTGNYLDIQDSNASPANVWYALNSVDSGNNTNWQFSSNSFLLFF